MFVRAAVTGITPQGGRQVSGNEQRAPQLALPHVRQLVRPRGIERVPIAPDDHVPERDRRCATLQWNHPSKQTRGQPPVHLEDAASQTRAIATEHERQRYLIHLQTTADRTSVDKGILWKAAVRFLLHAE